MILSIISGFIFGIFIGSVVTINFTTFLIFSFILTLFVFYHFISKPEIRPVIFLLVLFFVGNLVGITRVYLSDLYAHSKLDSLVGKQIFVKGIIVSEPDVRDEQVKLTVSTREIRVGTTTGEVIKVTEDILISTSLYPEFSYGDEVGFKTVLKAPEAFDSDGRVFDYKNYLRARGIWYTGKFTHVTFVSEGHGSYIKTILFKIKNAFTERVQRVLPEPESSLLGGLLLGGKRSLGEELLLEFSHAGVSHVVVLSGYNIAIVAESIIKLLSFLPSAISFGFGILGIVLFTVMSGGGASAIRAMLMVLVALFAKRFGREYHVARAFGFAVVAMLAPNPLLLVFDPSFQLSVLATTGLIFVSPFLTPYMTRVTEKYGLREIVSSTIATQLTVLPFLIYSNGIVSLTALPVNILILGTIPPTMFFGFVTGMVGFVSTYLSYIPALPTYVLLWYQLSIVHIGATPFGWFTLPTFSKWIVVFVYVLISIFLFILHKRSSLREK